MKKLTTLIMALVIFAVLLPAACAETSPLRNVILLTEYQQIGWGETFQLGVVDSVGNLWFYESSSRGEVPYDKNELLAWAEATDQLELCGTLKETVLTDITSLVQTVSPRKTVYLSGACDAGEQTSLAIRKDGNGETEIIELGASGDSVYENTDPAAQSLYKTLRMLFPGITAFDGDASIAPAGFRAADILTFCGYEGIDLTKLTMTAYANDCEAGATEIEPVWTAADIAGMTVTGKQNSLAVTGNTVTYCFRNAEGSTVASFEFYNELLICPDGMYTIGK